MKHSQWIVLLLALLLLLPACAAPDVSNPAGSSAPATTSPVTEAPPAVPIYRGEPLTYTAGERDETVDGGIRLSDLTAADGKKLYRITTLAAAPAEADWATVPAVCVDTYQWRDNGYEPAVFAQVVFVPEDGFYARLVCREADPYYTATEYLGAVWNDSCLEFFADWGNSGSYTNVEVNAYGASYQGFGISMKERSVFPTPRVGVSSLVREEEWEVRLSVPLTLLEELYPGLTVSPGYTFTGNFYKCGSKCEFPHYGMWNPIDSPSANFHLPAFFGYLTVS